MLLRNIEELNGYDVHAADGKIGKVKDFYFEDSSWTIRYIVVDIGGWLSGRRIIISPTALKELDWENEVISLSLNKNQVKESPDIDTSKPISREYEEELHRYYKWPLYWDYGSVTEEARRLESQRVSHLRTVEEVIGYRVKATEGELGPLLDLVFDPETWVIRYMIVSTRYLIEHARDLIKGKKVLISPDWTEISWAESEIYVDIPIDIVKDGPEYDKDIKFDRNFEEIIHNYYNMRLL